jgi:hypothetical protein
MEQLDAVQVSESKQGGEVVKVFDATPWELLDSATLHVLGSNGIDALVINGKEVTIEVFGPGSQEAVKMQHASGRKIALRQMAILRGKLSPNAAAEADAERAEKLAAITKAVNNFPYAGGPRAMYANPKLCYIADQVEAFYNDKSNFSPPSSTNSQSTSDNLPG